MDSVRTPTAPAHHTRWLQVHHSVKHETIPALCSEVNSLTSFFSLPSEHSHPRYPAVRTGADTWMRRKTRQRTESSAICSTCQGACRVRPAGSSPFQFTLGSRARLQKSPADPPPIGLRSLRLHLGVHRHFPLSPQSFHNLQVNKKRGLLLYAQNNAKKEH